MSSLTRGRRGNRVTFTADGSHLTGVLLELSHDSALVGVQSTEKPMVWNKSTKRWVANNQLWVVPFTHISETGV